MGVWLCLPRLIGNPVFLRSYVKLLDVFSVIQTEKKIQSEFQVIKFKINQLYKHSPNYQHKGKIDFFVWLISRLGFRFVSILRWLNLIEGSKKKTTLRASKGSLVAHATNLDLEFRNKSQVFVPLAWNLQDVFFSLTLKAFIQISGKYQQNAPSSIQDLIDYNIIFVLFSSYFCFFISSI